HSLRSVFLSRPVNAGPMIPFGEEAPAASAPEFRCARRGARGWWALVPLAGVGVALCCVAFVGLISVRYGTSVTGPATPSATAPAEPPVIVFIEEPSLSRDLVRALRLDPEQARKVDQVFQKTWQEYLDVVSK